MTQIPKIVEVILEEYQELVKSGLPNTLEGLYLHGSIALDAFEKGKSDIDFIAITNQRLTEDVAGILSEIHRAIAQKYRTPEMDGVYLTWEDLGKTQHDDQSYFYYNNGNLSYGPYFNANPVTWTLFASKGISILGPEVTNIEFETSSQQLKSFVLINMNTYWASRVQWLEESSLNQDLKLSSEDIQEEIEWMVLGLLRQYYTLMEGETISKTAAGVYGLNHFPKEYHRIIKEAVNGRMGRKESLFNSERERLESIIEFSKYLVGYCNRIFAV